jgi:hypothetical protein
MRVLALASLPLAAACGGIVSTDGPSNTGGSGGDVGAEVAGGLGGVPSVRDSGGRATGGSPSGGTPSGGTVGTGGAVRDITLTAIWDGQLHALWRNGTDRSVFLRGCGSVDLWQHFWNSWLNDGQQFVVCAAEVEAVELPPGATYADPYSCVPDDGAGAYQLAGPYGTNCTRGLPLAQAHCASLETATSNSIQVP